MTKYREIIRHGLGFSQRGYFNGPACWCSHRKLFVKFRNGARDLKLSWPLDEAMTDTELQRLMFSKGTGYHLNKVCLTYNYIHKELTSAMESVKQLLLRQIHGWTAAAEW